jgi:hypothetical protein
MILKLKQMKFIPLETHPYLASINEFQENTIYLPMMKEEKYSKDLKIVLDDIPTIDKRLIQSIEERYPQRWDSIKQLLLKLGTQ